MPVPLKEVIFDPDWIPHAFDPGGDSLIFVQVPRAARDELTFLSDEHYKGRYPKETYPLSDVEAAAGALPEAPRPHFIFHTSFCCSTLLARALDVRGRAVSLKEPDVFLHLANRFIRSGDAAAEQRRLDLTLRLLGRRYDEGEPVIVKPSNLANRLLMPSLMRHHATRAVLLYSDLRTLLRSLAKKGLWGRIFGRQLYRNLAAWTTLRLGFNPVETFDQTDLQIAGLAWLMHIHQFNEAARQIGPDRLVLLNSNDFLNDVPGSIERAARLFGMELDDPTIRAIAGGPTFAAHSKLSQSYTPEDREREHAAVDAAHGEEIGMVLKWIAAVAEHSGMPLQPSMLAG